MIKEGRIQKQKVIQDFENELEIKTVENKEKFKDLFEEILENVYKHSFQDIKASITRLGTLSILMIKDHKYIYLELVENQNYQAMLSVTMINSMENTGVYFLSLDEALKKISVVCRQKV